METYRIPSASRKPKGGRIQKAKSFSVSHPLTQSSAENVAVSSGKSTVIQARLGTLSGRENIFANCAVTRPLSRVEKYRNQLTHGDALRVGPDFQFGGGGAGGGGAGGGGGGRVVAEQQARLVHLPVLERLHETRAGPLKTRGTVLSVQLSFSLRITHQSNNKATAHSCFTLVIKQRTKLPYTRVQKYASH